MKGIIFDLDGTLIDSAPDIHAAVNALMRAMGYQPLSFPVVRSFIGNGIPKLIERVMVERDLAVTVARHHSLTARFQALYAEKPAVKTQFYPGVPKMLTQLRQEGYLLGICTNKAHDLTMKVLDSMGITDQFAAIIGGDSLPVKKPDPAPFFACKQELGANRLVYVGDSEVDAATARAARVPFALFTEGYRKTPVAAIHHDVAFSEFSRLPALLPALLATKTAA